MCVCVCALVNYVNIAYNVPFQVVWRHLYSKSSRDYGTLAFFRNRINRIAVSKDPTKEVNACIDFLTAVMKGHWLACACEVLSIPDVSAAVTIPAGSTADFLQQVAEQVVERCTIVESAFSEFTAANRRHSIQLCSCAVSLRLTGA